MPAKSLASRCPPANAPATPADVSEHQRTVRRPWGPNPRSGEHQRTAADADPPFSRPPPLALHDVLAPDVRPARSATGPDPMAQTLGAFPWSNVVVGVDQAMDTGLDRGDGRYVCHRL